MQSFMVSGILFGANTLKNVFTNIASALEEGEGGGFVGRGTDSNSPEEIFYSNETNPHFSLDLDANART